MKNSNEPTGIEPATFRLVAQHLIQCTTARPSNRNEYQEYFLWGKGGRCVWLTTIPPARADCLEIGSLNLLEISADSFDRGCSVNSGTVQLVTGT